MVNRNLILCAGISTAALLAASAAHAQTAQGGNGQAAPQSASGSTASQDNMVGEIIVTANKREQNLSKVGSSISALSADQLSLRRIANVADLAQATPGLIFAPSPDATPVYTLRGIGFYENSLAAYPDVSLYIDQAPLPLPAMAALTAFDLERVEVLKGPQGTLFGNNATGGAINFVAAKPTREFAAGAEVSYGRFNTIDISGFVSGPITETLRARLAVKAVKGDDWQRSLTRRGNGGTKYDTIGQQNNIAARLLLDWDASEALRFSLNLNGWRNRDDPQVPQNVLNIPTGTIPIPVYNSPVMPNNARVAEWGGDRPYQNDLFKQATLRGDYDFGGATLTSMTGYSDLKKRGAFENDGTIYYDGGDSAFIIGRVKSFTQELRLANESSSRFRWVVGANYEHTSVDQDTGIDFRDAASSVTLGITRGVASSRSVMNNYAGFANGEFDVTDQITLKAGIRRTQAKRSFSVLNHDFPGFLGSDVQNPFGAPGVNLNDLFTGFSAFFRSLKGLGPLSPIPLYDSIVFLDTAVDANGNPVNPDTYFSTGTYRAKLNEKNTSWSVGVDFKPTDTLLLYANVSKGYKAGGFPHQGAASFEGYRPVVQESLLDYEVGFKAQLLDRKLSINGAAFYYDYSNKQVKGKFIDPIFNGLDVLSNVPKSVVKGAELDIQARPVEGLSISAAGTYLDAKVKEFIAPIGSTDCNTLPVGSPGYSPVTGFNCPINGSFAGVRLPFSPKFQYTVRVDYDFPVSTSLNAFVGAGVNGQSQTIGILSVATGTTLAPRSTFLLNARALVSLNAGIRSSDDRWKLSLWGKNVFNKFYAINTVQVNDTVARYTGRPAEYGVSLAVKF